MTYEIKMICACEIIDDRNPAKSVFRIVRQAKDGTYKNLDFEVPSVTASKFYVPPSCHGDWRMYHHVMVIERALVTDSRPLPYI